MNLATIEKITKVDKHPDADKLDIATVLGYKCVVPKDLYTVDDVIIFIKPDTILPDDSWATEYKKYAPKRVKAVKIRGVWSDGIIVPLGVLSIDYKDTVIGTDVSYLLNLSKYEPPLPHDVQAKSSVLPFNLPKTDEDRWESLKRVPFGDLVDVSLKIDGTSMTVFYDLDTDYFGLTGRKQELLLNAENKYTAVVKKYDLENKLRDYCKAHNVSLAIRGELYGEGIQTMSINPHSKMPVDFAAFSVYILSGERRGYSNRGEEFYFVDVAEALGIPHVPVIETGAVLTEELLAKYQHELTTVNEQPFEGVVIKHSSGTFKVINAYYDSKK